jgi:hypothetical protein
MRRVFFATVTLLCLVATSAPAAETVASGGNLEVAYQEADRTIIIRDREAGPILTGGVVQIGEGKNAARTDQEGIVRSVGTVNDGAELVLRLKNKAAVRVRLTAEGQGSILVEDPQKRPATCQAQAAMGDKALIAMGQGQAAEDNGVLVNTLGPAEVPGARSLFDPERDLLVTAGNGQWQRAEGGSGWTLHARSKAPKPLLALKVQRHYYRDTLGIRYYAPIRKRTRWPTAPVVAMTWYGIQGWKGNPAQRKEWLYPNIDWVAEHLLPYAGPNLVFQLDDNYLKNDETMRAFSDYIRAKGMLPGIWFTPYVVAPKEAAKDHPEWFLHNKQGKLLDAFGGHSYGWGGTWRNRAGVIDVTNDQAVEQWYAMWWRKASETWNNEFFKIDGQTHAIQAYRQAVEANVDDYRKGLRIARSIVGKEKFINACWGIPLEAMGPLDGSRTGHDTGNKGHAIDVVLRWNFLNNVCWYCDPDAAANLYRATVERTRLNAQARVLTGQQFLTDDVWVKVPPEIARVWQLSFPMLDIHPANLYSVKSWQRYDLFDLRIAKPWGSWDVVGLFNYGGGKRNAALDLGRLPLEAERVHVYEFWSRSYLGEFPADASIPRPLKPHEGQVFAVVPSRGARPQLVSTSRHVSQGGLDLERLAWSEDDGTWTAAGRSTHLVAGDPYELAFASGRYEAAKASASQGSVAITSDGPLSRVRIEPERGGEADWQVTFQPIQGARTAVFPTALDIAPGDSQTVQVKSLGTEGVTLRLRARGERLAVSPAEITLGPWPAMAKVTVKAKAEGLKRGQTWTGSVALQPAGDQQPTHSIEVRVAMPPPENLARKAAAAASSVWPGGYEAARAIDGDDTTRWNSEKGDQNGAWLELRWKTPVEFNRVVIDECMDFGHRIQAWRLEAGDEKLKTIARGKQANRHHAVDLEKAVTARRLRLTVEKASEVPTLWELEVYHMPPKP